MSAPPPALKISKIWPTKLVRRRLAGFEPPNAALLELIRNDERRESDYTARYQEQDFFAREDAPVDWLRGEIDFTVESYLHHVGTREKPAWRIEGWYNVNRQGDHHAPHAHPGAYLSGTYYAQVPGPAERAAGGDADWACISFHDPRVAANMLARGGEPDARPVHVVRPSAGTLMLWPAMLQHSVHPNPSREPRVTVSFNVVLENVYR